MSTSHRSKDGARQAHGALGCAIQIKQFAPTAVIAVVLGITIQNVFAASVIGVVTESSKASIGGSPVLRGQTVLSGDSLLVGEGAAVILLAPTTPTARAVTVTLRRDTQVSFQREPDGSTIALLARGDLSFSHESGNPDFGVRTGNVTIRPASHLRTLGVVTISEGALTIAAASGSVRLEESGQPMEIPEGKAVRLQAGSQSGSDTSTGTIAPTGSTVGTTGPSWAAPVICGLAGGIVGSIPVIVKEESVSSDVGGWWATIPGGIAAGTLICELPKKNLPLDCSLGITSDYIYRAKDINQVQSAWPANYTLNWTSLNATALTLTYTLFSEHTGIGQAGPVHPAGALALPSGQKTYPAPDLAKPDHIEYTLTASRPGASKTCEADVQILAPVKATCILTREPYVVYENLPQATLTWTSSQSTQTATMNPGGMAVKTSGTMGVGGPGQPQLKVGHNVFTLNPSNARGPGYACTADIIMEEDPCGNAIRDLAAAVILEKEYRDIGDVITVGTAGGGKVAIGSVTWVLKYFGKASGLVSKGMVDHYCEQLAICKVRNGHANSGNIEYYNALGNVAATCTFTKNPDGTITSKGELSGRLKGLGITK
jgi:hypothetical protein